MMGGDGRSSGRLIAVLVACLSLIACSSGGETSTSSISTVASISSGSPGTMAPTSADPSSTVPSMSTASTTSTPPEPTSTSSTTVDPTPSAELAAKQAVDQAISDFTTCLLALPMCDPAMLATSRSDPMLAVNTSRINEWNAAGYAVIDRDQFRYVIERVELSDDGRRAVVTVCFADGSKLVEPGAGPDGADLIIDGTFTSGREAWDVRLDDDGVWRAYDAPLVGAAEATDVCPAV